MAIELRFPDVGEGITEGEIVRWLVCEGDEVRLDQPLVEVETDKAVVEIPAPRVGSILRIAAAAGERIRVGQLLVVIGESGERVCEAGPAAGATVVGALRETVRELPPVHAPRADSRDGSNRARGTPAVRRLARELGVDLGRVAGGGPDGRILAEDVVAASGRRGLPAPADTAERAADGAVEPIELSALRRTIAETMVRSARTVVPVTTTDDADVTELVSLRQGLAGTDGGSRPGLLAFVLKTVAVALGRHPHLNATLGEGLRQLLVSRSVHLGVATDTADGLIVPVVRDADRKTVHELAVEVERLSALARERRIGIADLRGATFTVSNFGSIGGIYATPVVQPPQVAILGLGRAALRPVVYHGTIAARTILPLSLTFDHRALDGATAVRFLNEIIALLAKADWLGDAL